MVIQKLKNTNMNIMTDQVKTKDGRYFGKVKRVIESVEKAINEYFYYDEWGNKTEGEHIEYDNYNNIIFSKHTYDIQLGEVYTNVSRNHFIYDCKNRLIEKISFVKNVKKDDNDESSNKLYRTLYFYNDDDLLIEIRYNGTNRFDRFFHDAYKQCIKKEEHFDSKVTVHEYSYNFDNLLEKEVIKKNNKLDSTCFYYYNNDRLLYKTLDISFIYCDDSDVPEPETIITEEFYDFDEYKNPQKSRINSDGATFGELNKTISYEYYD